MIVYAGEAYGYHCAAILWLAAHCPQIASIWFDSCCRLKPFMIKNLEAWANDKALQELFQFAVPNILALAEAAYCVDELHGAAHNKSCKDEFLGTMHRNIPSYRGGACGRTGGYWVHPEHSRNACAGVQVEHLNRSIAIVSNPSKHMSAPMRLERLVRFLGDLCRQQLHDLPHALTRDAQQVRAAGVYHNGSMILMIMMTTGL